MLLKDANFWYAVGAEELSEALNQPENNENVAKNVILFLGDGFGFQSIMATRIYIGQQNGYSGEEHKTAFERFPHVGLAKVNHVPYTNLAIIIDHFSSDI